MLFYLWYNININSKGKKKMKIKQHGKSIISTEEVLNIIDLMIKDNINFKQNKVSKVIIWNSKLLFIIYSLLNLDIVTKCYRDIISGSTKACYDEFTKNIQVFVFNRKKDYLDHIEDKNDIGEFLRLQFVSDLVHEFRHDYQSIFFPDKYNKDSINYKSNDGWEDQWIEQDAMKYSDDFMINNHEVINKLLDIKMQWKLRRKQED